MSTIIDEIRTAREVVTRLEAETSESGHLLRLSKEKLRKARGELDALLQELVSGQSRYPLPGFDRLDLGDAAGNGQASTPTAEASTAPLRGRRKRAREAP